MKAFDISKIIRQPRHNKNQDRHSSVLNFARIIIILSTYHVMVEQLDKAPMFKKIKKMKKNN